MIKGVNLLGRVIELRLIAPSASDANRQAEDAGPKFVVATDAPDRIASLPPELRRIRGPQ